MNYKILLVSVLALLALLPHNAAAAAPPASTSSPFINCNQMFAGGGIGLAPGSSAGSNPYIPQLASITGYGSIVAIALLVVLMMFCVTGAAYAIGYAFHINSLLTFAKTEMLEAFANVVIIVVIGVGASVAFGAISFFVQVGSLQPGATAVPTVADAHALYLNMCSNIQKNIMENGLVNWIGIYLNLILTNFLAQGTPPAGGFKIHLMPNGFGVAFSPYYGMALATQLIWDEQLAYFNSIFLGMFLVILLFTVYFLFPLFLYVGIVLRSFPWTRPAGASLISLFIAFYIVFPALFYPFTVSIDSHAGEGFCTNPQFSAYGTLCNSQNFLDVSWGDYANLLTFQLGDLYYSDTASFMSGMEFVGLSAIGLIVSMLISYEIVEKLGDILGSPSLEGTRLLSRIL